MGRDNAGFLAMPVALYAALGALLALGGLGLWVKIETSRYNALKAEYEQFRGGVEALGLAAKKAAAEKEAADKSKKEEADALHRAAVDSLNADIRRLRSQRARGGGLSKPIADAGGADRTCFDDAKFVEALRRLDDGVFGLIGEGDRAVVDLNAAKGWAQKR